MTNKLEEKLPSLKNNYMKAQTMGDGTYNILINEETLRLRCQDNQKVKDAIDYQLDDTRFKPKNRKFMRQVKKELLEELGLK